MAEEKTDSKHASEEGTTTKGVSSSELPDLDMVNTKIEEVKGGAARSDQPIFDRIGQGM